MTRHDDTDDRRALAPVLVCQRWRIVYRRTASVAGLPQRALETAWLAALEASGLPVAPTGPGSRRPKVVFGPPIPAGALGERELLDVHLLRRVTTAEVRRRLQPVVAAGCELVDIYDVWVGAPALPAAVVAVDYRLELDVGPSGGPRVVEALRAAARGLLAAERLPRVRVRGHRLRAYDLRPFLLDLRADPADGGRVGLAMRLRAAPETGVGRPDEVVRALLETTTDEEALVLLRSACEDWLTPPPVGVTDGAAGGSEGSEGGGEVVGVGMAGPPVRAEQLIETSRAGAPDTGDAAPEVIEPVPPAGHRRVLVVRERLVTADELAAESVTGVSPGALGPPSAPGRGHPPGQARPPRGEAPGAAGSTFDEGDPAAGSTSPAARRSRDAEEG